MKTSLPYRAVCIALFTLAGGTDIFFNSSTAIAAEMNGDPETVAIDPAQNPAAAARAVAAEVKAMVGEGWEKVKEATYEQRATVSAAMTIAEASLDANIQQWTARKDTVATEVRPTANTALDELRNSREVLRQKVDNLDNATVETWTSVMSELNSAWQRVRTASGTLAARLEQTPSV